MMSRRAQWKSAVRRWFLMAALPSSAFAQYTYTAMVTENSDQASSAVVAAGLLNAGAKTTTNAVTNRIQNAINSVGRSLVITPRSLVDSDSSRGSPIKGGAASSDRAYGVGVWGSYDYSHTENDLVSTAFDADTHTVMVGADKLIKDRYILGLALGYERTDSDTIFNRGELNIR